MISVAQMNSADLSAAATLITDLRSDMNNRVVCTVDEMRAVLMRALTVSSYTGFLARDDAGEAVGFLGLNNRFAIYAGGEFSQITELYVVPEARRRGVARALITAAEDKARANGSGSMELGAPRNETHPGTHAFYSALGYRITGPRLSKTLAG